MAEEEINMRLSRVGACIAVMGVYLALRFTVLWIKPISISPQLVAMLYTALLMLVQLSLVVSIARLQLRPRPSVLLSIPSAVIVAALIYIEMKLSARTPAPQVALGMVSIFRSLFLMLFAGLLGYTISFIVREKNILLPAAIFAALVDYWNVSWGPLSHILVDKPSVVAAAAVSMPAVSAGMPGMIIGMGDFVFLSLFFGVLYRFRMNVKGTFWLGYGLLTASMLAVMYFGSAFPALIPMSLAVVAANAKLFKLKREEQLAMVYVGALLLAALILMWIFMFRR